VAGLADSVRRIRLLNGLITAGCDRIFQVQSAVVDIGRVLKLARGCMVAGERLWFQARRSLEGAPRALICLLLLARVKGLVHRAKLGLQANLIFASAAFNKLAVVLGGREALSDPPMVIDAVLSVLACMSPDRVSVECLHSRLVLGGGGHLSCVLRRDRF